MNGITADGSVAGWYMDANNVNHGFVRSADGHITKFDVPGAGTGAGQGTVALGMNDAGAITGRYDVSNNGFYAYVRSRDGKITTFEAPGAGRARSRGPQVGALTQPERFQAFTLTQPLPVTAMSELPMATSLSSIRRATEQARYQGVYTSFFYGLNPAGMVVAQYSDSSNVFHGFVRAPNGPSPPSTLRVRATATARAPSPRVLIHRGRPPGPSQTRTMCITACSCFQRHLHDVRCSGCGQRRQPGHRRLEALIHRGRSPDSSQTRTM